MFANTFAKELHLLQITRAEMLYQLYLNNMHLGSRPIFPRRYMDADSSPVAPFTNMD